MVGSSSRLSESEDIISYRGFTDRSGLLSESGENTALPACSCCKESMTAGAVDFFLELKRLRAAMPELLISFPFFEACVTLLAEDDGGKDKKEEEEEEEEGEEEEEDGPSGISGSSDLFKK
jgi:hypothetical protein